MTVRSGRNQFDAPWTFKEVQNLTKEFPHLFPEEVGLVFPNRTSKAVREKAKTLHLYRGERVVLRKHTYGNNIDGGYVSGLVDGEGWFMVSVKKRSGVVTNYNPKFGITLRSDDRKILQWVQYYFGCGSIRTYAYGHFSMTTFVVASLYELLANVIPHFDCYPLRAKKQRDFFVWKEMVLLQAKFYRKDWPKDVLLQMKALYDQLRSGRKFIEEEFSERQEQFQQIQTERDDGARTAHSRRNTEGVSRVRQTGSHSD